MAKADVQAEAAAAAAGASAVVEAAAVGSEAPVVAIAALGVPSAAGDEDACESVGEPRSQPRN